MTNRLAVILAALFISLFFCQPSFAQTITPDYITASPVVSSDMYAPPAGYRLAEQRSISIQLGRIATKILYRAVNEHWVMPSEIQFSFGNKQYIARFQYHGANKQIHKKHLGIGLYERVERVQ